MTQSANALTTNQRGGGACIAGIPRSTRMGIVTFSTYNGTIVEERMAGNANNRSIVFQAAESVLATQPLNTQ